MSSEKFIRVRCGECNLERHMGSRHPGYCGKEMVG